VSRVFYEFFVPGVIVALVVAMFTMAVKADKSKYDRNYK
jgi:hypothetical protein